MLLKCSPRLLGSVLTRACKVGTCRSPEFNSVEVGVVVMIKVKDIVDVDKSEIVDLVKDNDDDDNEGYVGKE